MRRLSLLCVVLLTWFARAVEVEDFVTTAQRLYGDSGAKAARFLVDNMPPGDRETLTNGFLLDHLSYSLRARDEFSWAREVPEEIFFNDVLPYSVFDETREAWRPAMYERARAIVKDCRTATEAAQALNRQLFNLVQVHYNTGRKQPNQSPSESMASGKATCTGLSILLVDACRAVGIPARAVGTLLWANNRGNHTWVEIWDNGWKFTGADEYDAAGLNRGWFVGDASQATASDRRHAIFATSWKRLGESFPLVWATNSQSVAAVNVTDRYVRPAASTPTNGQPTARLGLRLMEKAKGERIAAPVKAVDGYGRVLATGETKAGRADLNDMPRLDLAVGAKGWLRFTVAGETREVPFGPLTVGESTVDAVWSDLALLSPAIAALETRLLQAGSQCTLPNAAGEPGLSRSDAARAIQLLLAHRLNALSIERKAEFEAQQIELQGKSLRWMVRTFGDTPPGGHSLWISMHGGGGAPKEVNDQQWTNQIHLYEPAEGIYVAPRAPTDTWNLWHEAHIDPMFSRLIEDYVVLAGVNPNRVYLMGYSAGGDGVWQLAPRMADQLAAASMMAGHPNDASQLGLRNLPFAIFMGGKDAAYDRNRIAAEKAAILDDLEKGDPGAYVHQVHIYPECGHWMNNRDREAIPWMVQYLRNPWPTKVVWYQSSVPHNRYYWLELDDAAALKSGQKLIAEVTGQTITLSGDVPPGLRLRLSDQLLNLDQNVVVQVNGTNRFSGKVERHAEAILTSLNQRADIPAVATAGLLVP